MNEPTDWTVAINDEEQYSIWPADRPLPSGWASVGDVDSKDNCLAEIEKLWIDMRPKSAR